MLRSIVSKMNSQHKHHHRRATEVIRLHLRWCKTGWRSLPLLNKYMYLHTKCIWTIKLQSCLSADGKGKMSLFTGSPKDARKWEYGTRLESGMVCISAPWPKLWKQDCLWGHELQQGQSSCWGDYYMKQYYTAYADGKLHNGLNPAWRNGTHWIQT